MATQASNGHAFEYSLLVTAKEYLENNFNLKDKIKIKETTKTFSNAKNDFLSLEPKVQKKYLAAAHCTLKSIVEVEPYLWAGILSNKDSFLSLFLQADDTGKKGDVRDMLFNRTPEAWEIGISAKHNHAATKHCRLSPTIDFGKEWMGIPCKQIYFDSINQTFLMLRQYNGTKTRWREVWKTPKEKNKYIYTPILAAFKNELLDLLKINQIDRVKALIDYLLGREDFYKVVFSDKTKENTLDIAGFNLNGKLNQTYISESEKFAPTVLVNKLKYPTKIVDIDIDPKRNNTILVSFDMDWSFAFRIHNASEYIENSLKFDVRLTKTPTDLWKQHILLP